LIVHISQTQFIEPNLTFDIVSSFIVLTPTIRVHQSKIWISFYTQFQSITSSPSVFAIIWIINSIKKCIRINTHSKNLQFGQ
jgi:hypothetical protein